MNYFLTPISRFLLLGFCILFWTPASTIGADTLLPDAKEMIQLVEGDRNPFGRAIPPKTAAPKVSDEGETEESQLQALLQKMNISGTSDGPRGRSVLLQRMRLQVGDILPSSLINGQTEILRIEAIYPDRVELVFLEKGDKPLTRTVTIQFSLSPWVRQRSGGQDKQNRKSSVEFFGKILPSPSSDGTFKK